MHISLDGKIALITGGSRGIGRGIALEFARSGADVVVNYSRDISKAEEVRNLITEIGQRCVIIKADVSNSAAVDLMTNEILDVFSGKLDILVNNAGIYPRREVIKMTDRELDAVIDTNLKGSFYVTRAVARQMIKRKAGGRIISISSAGAGHSGRFARAHYCASKAGLITMSKSLAIELASFHINVNTISAGFIDVGQYDLPELQGAKHIAINQILKKRPGTPEDIAYLATFLASEQADWITGSDFCIDGGASLGSTLKIGSNLKIH